MKSMTEVVHVRWSDSSIYRGEACQPEDVSWSCENESAGLLVREDETTVTIALDRCVGTGDIRLALCIQKVNITSIRRFSVRGRQP